MKTKHFSTLILIHLTFCIGYLTTYAQSPITITGADLPQAGQNFILANDTSPNILLGTPGSSPQTWDFITLNNHYYKAAVYDSTSSTPYAANFPTSNISTYGPAEYFGALFGGAPVSAGYDGYMFWSSDNNGLKVIGWRAIEGQYAGKNIYVNPTELLIGAPATYGTNFTDSSKWQLFLGEVPSDVDTTYISNRKKTLVCDAWGLLNTPFGNFSDIIRIHEIVEEIDSVIATLNSIPVYSMELFRDTFNNYMYMANGIGYPLAIVHADKNNNVKDVEYLIDTTCSVYTKILGTITNSNGDTILSGKVYLHKYIQNQTQFSLVDSADINSGVYGFYNVQFGNYIVSVQSNATLCPTCIPTYFSNSYSWNSALSLYTLCIDTMIANISLLQISPMNGNGFCSGVIQFGSGKTTGDPVPGVDIFIEQIPGGIKGHTTTDLNGNFSFTNLEPGKYRLWVDIPGLPMDSTYEFIVSSNDSSFTNLNFTVDNTSGSGAIYVGYSLGTSDFRLPTSDFKIYPNPNDGEFYLQFTNYDLQFKKAELIIYNLLGEIIYAQKLTTNNQQLTTNILSGIYFWKLMKENNVIGTGKISIIK